MKKKNLARLMVLGLGLALCLPASAYADGQKVVTLGADLSPEQRDAVLKYFGVYGQNVDTMYITNQDERNHLGGYVPLEQIGTRTFSCAYVRPTQSGGIQVKTANLNWVTSNMIASTLSTSGVVNCEVLAAAPFEVSGTGALTGIIMAYEQASGASLDQEKKEIATQELITTGTIANNVGQNQATNIVNDIKMQVIQGQIVDPYAVEKVVDEVVESNHLSLSQEDYDLLYQLMDQIAQQRYDYDDMKTTLERVDSNVNQLQQDVQQFRTEEEFDYDDEWDDAFDDDDAEVIDDELDEDSILMQTDDWALGEGVIVDATAPEAVEDVPVTFEEAEQEQQIQDVPDGSIDGFDFAEGDAYYEEPADEPEEFDFVEQDAESMPEEVQEILPEEAPKEYYEEEAEPEEDVYEEIEEDAEEDMNEEDAPAEAAIVVDQIDTDDVIYAGNGQIMIHTNTADLIPVSGTLTITDGMGNDKVIDVENNSDVTSAATPSDICMENMWNEGTTFVVNSGYTFYPGTNYYFSLNIKALDSMTGESYEVSRDWSELTKDYGMTVNNASMYEMTQGSMISGSMIFNEQQVYAQLTDCDDQIAVIDNQELTPEYSGFTMTCMQKGFASFTFDFYDADGGYLGEDTFTFYVS